MESSSHVHTVIFKHEEKEAHYEVADESDPEQRHGEVELQVLKKPAHTVQTDLHETQVSGLFGIPRTSTHRNAFMV